MLNKILNALQQTSGPISLRELSRKLDIEANALSGMIEVLVQKGKLSVDDDPHSSHNGPNICSCGNSGDVMDCPYIAPMPTMYSIRK
ncbi:MAG: winged helix-turn-helix transcriptional regulator [Anaerolineales bacterium]|nr:winged helix-turn-helix transcriptional regulator [Anaerolineales bacterium]MCA9927816.1 winged helix-turn-helix transcriptional regulator [Anaerolineales bacterium]